MEELNQRMGDQTLRPQRSSRRGGYARWLGPLAALLVLWSSLALPAGAVGVRPLVIDLEVRAGETAPFELILSPSGQRERVQVRLFQPVQLPTGDLTYTEADPALFPASAWVKLEEDEVEVPAAQEVRVAGRVDVPFGVSGSHTVVLMVEPVVESQGGGVTIQVRYAVRLNIRVPGVGAQARADVAQVQLVADAEGRPWVQASVLNPSPVDYLAEVQATVRDANRRLIERLSLQTESGRRSGTSASRIYPQSRLDFGGRVTSPLLPGTYELQVFARYAEGRQAVARTQVVVREGQFELPDGRLLIQIDETHLELTAKPGTLTSTGFTVVNRTQEPVVVGAAPLQAGGRAEQVWPLLRLRTPFPFTLRPGQSRRVTLSLQTARDQAEQGYYGTLLLQAVPESELDQPRAEPQEIRLPVAVILGEVAAPALELGAAQYLPTEQAGPVNGAEGGPDGGAPSGEGSTVYVAVHNAGKRHVELEGSTLSIEDAGGEAVASGLSLALPAEPPWILPGAWAQLEAEGVPDLAPGRYTLHVTLRSAAETLLDQTMELVVGEEVGP